MLHLLHYIPERHSKEFDTIEDVTPVYNVSINVNLPADIKTVTLQPQGKPLEFSRVGKCVRFVVDVIEGHQMIVLQ